MKTAENTPAKAVAPSEHDTLMRLVAAVERIAVAEERILAVYERTHPPAQIAALVAADGTHPNHVHRHVHEAPGGVGVCECGDRVLPEPAMLSPLQRAQITPAAGERNPNAATYRRPDLKAAAEDSPHIPLRSSPDHSAAATSTSTSTGASPVQAAPPTSTSPPAASVGGAAAPLTVHFREGSLTSCGISLGLLAADGSQTSPVTAHVTCTVCLKSVQHVGQGAGGEQLEPAAEEADALVAVLGGELAARVLGVGDETRDPGAASEVRAVVSRLLGIRTPEAWTQLRDAAGVKAGECPTGAALRALIVEHVAPKLAKGAVT